MRHWTVLAVAMAGCAFDAVGAAGGDVAEFDAGLGGDGDGAVLDGDVEIDATPGPDASLPPIAASPPTDAAAEPDAEVPDWVGVYVIGKTYFGTCPGGDGNLSFTRLEFKEGGVAVAWNPANAQVPVRQTTWSPRPGGVHVGALVMATYSNGTSDVLEAFDASGSPAFWQASMVELVWGNPTPCSEVWNLQGTP